MMIAQLTLPPIAWGTTGNFLLGLIGTLSVVGLLLWIYNQGKRAFGRTPPIHEDLDARDKRLRQMIFASEKHLKEEQARQLRLITRLEEQYADMQADRVRKWEELHRLIAEQNAALAYIRGWLDEERRKQAKDQA